MPLGERRVAGQVGEQHGHLAALLGRDRGAGRTAGGGGAAGAAARRARAPQFMQKRASGGAGVPQFGQRRSSALPQFMQKRAPAGFSVPQAAQVITASEISGTQPALAVEPRQLRKQALRPRASGRGRPPRRARPGSGGYQNARSLRSRSSPGRTRRSSSNSSRDHVAALALRRARQLLAGEHAPHHAAGTARTGAPGCPGPATAPWPCPGRSGSAPPPRGRRCRSRASTKWQDTPHSLSPRAPRRCSRPRRACRAAARGGS